METPEIKPVTQRIFSIDVIRGIALMGILFINICQAGLPGAYDSGAIHFFNLNPADYYSWFISNMFIEGKMRCLFSFLFGAGVLLFTSKFEEQGLKATGAWYRRMLWLFLFGLIDVYIILWSGDILLEYAACGMLLFPMRKLKPVYLILIALVMSAWVSFVFNENFSELKTNRETYLQTEQLVKEGKKPNAGQEKERQKWINRTKHFYPFSNETIKLISGNIEKDILKKKQGYTDMFLEQAPENFEEEYSAFYAAIWETTAAMLIGMALFKWGFFSGSFSRKKYLLIALACFAIGFPFSYLVTYYPHSHAAHFIVNYIDNRSFDFAVYNEIGRLLVPIGYAAVIIMICNSGWLKKLTYALSCFGKTAFTNYIIQNIFITVFFNAYGFAQFGQYSRMGIYYIMAITWIIQITFSVIWLKYYKMGPLEWLWRSLTYKKFISNKVTHA